MIARIASPAGTLLKLTLTRALTSGETTMLTPACCASHKSSARALALFAVNVTRFVTPSSARGSRAADGAIAIPGRSSVGAISYTGMGGSDGSDCTRHAGSTVKADNATIADARCKRM
jgi:hypothetical protein